MLLEGPHERAKFGISSEWYRHRNYGVVFLVYRYNGLPTQHRSAFRDGLWTEEPMGIRTILRVKGADNGPWVFDLQLEFAVLAGQIDLSITAKSMSANIT